MPTYTSNSELINVLSNKVLGELTDDAAGATPDTDIMDSALERAEGVVNSALKKRYTVPLDTPAPKEIVHYVLTLAKCFLFGRRPGSVPEELQQECADVRQALKGLADGDTELSLDTVTSDPFGSDSDSDDEVFTKENIFT